MELVSVIVPVYNVEKYLKKCVDSILSQSYQNIEVILINDGSLDGSGEICEAYAKKDERIKYITQNNSGLGKTRNRGIEEASGKYLLFVDSDDYIENTMIEKLYHNITESHADVVPVAYIMCIDRSVFLNARRKRSFCVMWRRRLVFCLLARKFREARAISYIAQNCLIK